ncbi:ATP-binding protein [Bdellovibrio sp. ArHS]|uniref:ATP-binding protein n=1 Tax=Bdellovibrio sp. ArHS TaxID=1569284 RepID=UPI000A9675DE|nr:ATP-binding protein [Bdellovibrio sp. ArHS]
MKKKNEPDFRALFEGIPGLYLILSPDFHMVAMSDAYAQSTFLERDKVLGKYMFDVFPENPQDSAATGKDNVRSSLQQVVDTLQPSTMAVQKYDIRRPDGVYEERYWSPINVPFFGQDGKLLYIIHKVEDVTEFVRLRKHEQEQSKINKELKNKVGLMESDVLERAQEIQLTNKKLEALNRALELREKELQEANNQLAILDKQRTHFFANVSHELRTPVSLILGPVEKLLKDTNLTDAQKNYLQLVRRNGQLLLRQVNDLLDVAKFDAHQMTARYAAVDAASLVKQSTDNFSALAEEKGYHFAIETPAVLPIETDPEKFLRILLNLLGNAFKFTPNQGLIRCSLSLLQDQERPYVKLQVADSGPGVPENMRKNIFERFFQVQDSMNREKGGTGLGLSIVKDFVELMKGTVEVRSAPEGGALFEVLLPQHAPDNVEVAVSQIDHKSIQVLSQTLQDQMASGTEASAQRKSQDAAPPEAPVVLIVEDSPDLQKFIVEILSEEFRCLTAADGKDGYEKARQHKPDLILSDLMMPLYSGEYLVEQVMADPSVQSIPVIILTAKADDVLRAKLLNKGVQDYLTKPFQSEELLARVRNHARASRARQVIEQALQSKGQDLDKIAKQLADKNVELQELSRLKDEFLATLSHELRTPISIIYGYAEILSEELERTNETTEQALSAIQRNAAVQLRLVEDLVNLSKSITGKISLDSQHVEFSDLLKDALQSIENIAHAKGIKVRAQLVEASLWADPVRMTQVLWNILSNAVKFTPEKGQIDVAAQKDEHHLYVDIKDSGVGIKPEFLPYVFERFRQQDGSFTRKYGGLGLGLSIVKHLVDLHGGEVKIHSAGEGQGTTVTLKFPMYQGRDLRNETSTDSFDVRDLRGRKILVVEDEPEAVRMIKLILKKYGVEVVAAENADQAQELLKQMKPDVIVSDIGLPGKSGIEFIRSVRGREKPEEHIPAMALTAFTSQQTETKALDAGFEMYVPKPIESMKLVNALRRLIKEQSA